MVTRQDIFILDGRAYSWQQLCTLRRQQLEARRAANGSQLALFEMKQDCRPASECTAAARFLEPSLFRDG
jgi:hypothetical protein